MSRSGRLLWGLADPRVRSLCPRVVTVPQRGRLVISRQCDTRLGAPP